MGTSKYNIQLNQLLLLFSFDLTMIAAILSTSTSWASRLGCHHPSCMMYVVCQVMSNVKASQPPTQLVLVCFACIAYPRYWPILSQYVSVYGRKIIFFLINFHSFSYANKVMCKPKCRKKKLLIFNRSSTISWRKFSRIYKTLSKG